MKEITELIDTMKDTGYYPMFKNQLKSAEDRAAQLEAEIATAWNVVQAIRTEIDAYPEHDTIEAVKRVMGRLRDAEKDRDELTTQLSKPFYHPAFDEGDGTYKP